MDIPEVIRNQYSAVSDLILKGSIRQRPFCTGPSIGNQVDGLPIDLSKDAGSASCSLPGRAPIRIF